jgi:hypothetical protein
MFLLPIKLNLYCMVIRQRMPLKNMKMYLQTILFNSSNLSASSLQLKWLLKIWRRQLKLVLYGVKNPKQCNKASTIVALAQAR